MYWLMVLYLNYTEKYSFLQYNSPFSSITIEKKGELFIIYLLMRFLQTQLQHICDGPAPIDDVKTLMQASPAPIHP